MTKDKKIADEVVEEDKEDKEDKEDPTSPNYVEGDVLSHEEGREWYIVQCYTGQEYKVQVRVRDLVEEKLWQKRLFNILVPEEETVELKDNKRTEKRTKIYPGYVFVQMVLDDELYYEIRKLMGVAKFIGTKSNPTPVTDDEILKASKQLSENSGLFTEPAAATAFAGFQKFQQSRHVAENSKNIVLLTGSGLKDLASVQNIIEVPQPIKKLEEIKL